MVSRYRFRLVSVQAGYKRPYKEWIQRRRAFWPNLWPFFWRYYAQYATGFNAELVDDLNNPKG